MFTEQIIEFELGGFEPPSCMVVHVVLKLVIFMPKQRSSKKINLRVNYYLLLNILPKAMNLASFTWTKSITKFIKNMLNFKRESKQKED